MHPEVIAEFNRMKRHYNLRDASLLTDDVLSWVSKEVLKRQPSGGQAWTKMNRKDKLSKVLAHLAEVLGQPEDST